MARKTQGAARLNNLGLRIEDWYTLSPIYPHRKIHYSTDASLLGWNEKKNARYAKKSVSDPVFPRITR